MPKVFRLRIGRRKSFIFIGGCSPFFSADPPLQRTLTRPVRLLLVQDSTDATHDTTERSTSELHLQIAEDGKKAPHLLAKIASSATQPVITAAPNSASSISSACGNPLTAIAPTRLPSFQTGTPPPQPVNLGSPK